jgi:CheY-like chemotaxis protein
MKGRILCTEDDPDSREMLVAFLESYGFEVVCSADSKHALDLANRETFDLLLVDNWMPTLSGVDLTTRIREFDKTTPILFYSGAALPADRQEALKAGAQGYVAKPNLQEVIEEIERLTAKAKTACLLIP